MGQRLLFNPVPIDHRQQAELWDDFYNFNSAGSGQPWTDALTNSSAPVLSTTVPNGLLVMANTGAANDASFVYSTTPLYLWASAKPVVAEILLQFSEASINNANVWFGLSSLNTVAQLVNASAGPATSFSGAGIYKQGGGLNWGTISSQSTTQNINKTNYVAGQTGYTRLRVQCEVVQGVLEITYWIDQGNTAGFVQMQNTSSVPNNKIKDYITISSPAIMYLGWGIKNGTSAAETLNVDYVAGWAERADFIGGV